MSIQNKKLTIGLFGFGTVGAALYKVLEQTPSLNATVKRICIKQADKKRDGPSWLFTTDKDTILNDPDINVVVELIDDANAAYAITTSAISSHKAVVSANKKMIAEHLQELILLQKKHNISFLYEAAACASIPVIRNLEEYYDNDLLQGIRGVVNGSTNYILTKVFNENVGFETALQQAQTEGFAESDPSLDVNGTDAVNKLSILLAHAYGAVSEPSKIVHTGIQNLSSYDARYARSKGYTIKLLAEAKKLANGKVAAFVLPRFIDKSEQLYNILNENNGVVIESNLADNQFFFGKGAGGFPTASAVLSDLSALRYGYSYEYKKLLQQEPSELTDNFYLKVCVGAGSSSVIPHRKFHKILEWTKNEDRCYISGILSFKELSDADWWKQPGISLIVYPDGVQETLSVNEVSATEYEQIGVYI